MFAELFHPNSDDDFDKINQERVVCKLTNISFDHDNNQAVAHVELLKDKPLYVQVNKLFSDKQARFSIRMFSGTNKGKKTLEKIITWDVVKK